MADIRARYDEIFANCAANARRLRARAAAAGSGRDPRRSATRSGSELYDESGFGIWPGNFRRVFFDEAANREFSEFIADRIRQRVDDPDIAEKLIPKDHGFGLQRLPLETNYFEAYNRDNVELVDLSETPIERITATGIQTTAGHHDLDLIVYATGFDAITGGYDRIDIRGVDGQTLRDKWRHGPSTYLGLLTHGFPNLLMVAGPQRRRGRRTSPAPSRPA